MANFETEQKTALSPQQNGDDPSSIAICEDNLAALLRVMNGAKESEPAASQPEPPEQANIVPVDVVVPPVAESPVVADLITDPSREPESPLEPECTPNALSKNDAVSEHDASPAKVPGAVQDAVAAQDNVPGKNLRSDKVVVVDDALADKSPVVENIVVVESAIADKETAAEKDRIAENDAAAPRDAGTAGAVEAEAPQTPEALIQAHPEIAKISEPEAAIAAAGGETTEPASQALPKVASQLALLSSIKQRRTMTTRTEPVKLPVPEPEKPPAPVTPAVAATPVEAPPPPKTAAPAKKKRPEPAEISILLPIPDPAEEKPEPPRGNTYFDRLEQPLPAPAPRPAPSHTGPIFAPVVTATYTRTHQVGPKPKSFATSGVGLALIGGTVLAVGVTAYLLIGFDFKPVSTVAAPEAVTQESAPEKGEGKRGSTQRLAPGAPVADASRPAAPIAAAPVTVDSSKDARSASSVATPQSLRTDAAQKGDAVQTPAVENSAATVARTFTPPPAGARPANPILEAPPILAAGSPTPPLGTLPAGLAPLPPPATLASTSPGTALRQINVSGKVQAAKLVTLVKPAYPALARTTRVQGTVRFRATIGADGQIKSLTSLGGPTPLVQAAADAVRQWRYQPTLVNGEAVEVVTEIEVAFTL